MLFYFVVVVQTKADLMDNPQRKKLQSNHTGVNIFLFYLINFIDPLGIE